MEDVEVVAIILSFLTVLAWKMKRKRKKKSKKQGHMPKIGTTKHGKPLQKGGSTTNVEEEWWGEPRGGGRHGMGMAIQWHGICSWVVPSSNISIHKHWVQRIVTKWVQKSNITCEFANFRNLEYMVILQQVKWDKWVPLMCHPLIHLYIIIQTYLQ